MPLKIKPRLAALLVSTALTLASCSEGKAQAERQTRVLFAMDTVMELTAYTSDAEPLSLAEAKISELESKLSVTLEGSELYTLNSVGNAELSEATAHLLSSALELCEATDGALDVTVYPLVSAWGFTTDEHRIPSDAELEELLESVDYREVTLDVSTAAIPKGVMVDLGSVAKGYTGDTVVELLREHGISSALLNLGGNVQALGSKPDDSPWRIAVRHPIDNASFLGVLSIKDSAVITSGGYERYFIGEDGEVYWHIIDPATGRPADSGLISVTVVGDSGLLCDAMSTALFVMGLDAAIELWRSCGDFEAIFVTSEEEVFITEGLSDIFRLTEQYSDMELTVIKQ